MMPCVQYIFGVKINPGIYLIHGLGAFAYRREVAAKIKGQTNSRVHFSCGWRPMGGRCLHFFFETAAC